MPYYGTWMSYREGTRSDPLSAKVATEESFHSAGLNAAMYYTCYILLCEHGLRRLIYIF